MMCASIVYVGRTHQHTCWICAHGAKDETGLVFISYGTLMNGHDARVSKGAGTKTQVAEA